MEIHKIQITHNHESGEFNFENKTLVTSSENASGKTTLMRMIPWALGTKNQSLTDSIKSNSVNTKISFTTSGNFFILERSRNLMRVFDKQDNFLKSFDISNPVVYDDFIAYVFGMNRSQYELNSFSFVIDQDNGWKFINRGKTNYHSKYFILENDLAYLSLSKKDKEDIADIEAELSTLTKELNKLREYTGMSKGMSIYSKTIAKTNPELLARVNVYNRQIDELLKKREILEQKKINQTNIEDAVLENHFSIKHNGEIIKITRENMFSSQINKLWVKSEIEEINIKVRKIKKEVAILTPQINDQMTLFETEDNSEIIEHSIKLDAITGKMKAVMGKINSRKNELNSKKELILQKTDKIRSEFITLVTPTAKMLDIDPHRILTIEKWKGISGSTRMMLVLAIRIAYSKMLKKYAKMDIPMLIDSPAANEFDDNSIKYINELLETIDGQVIIATLDDGRIKVKNPDNIITIKKRLLKSKQSALDI